MDLVPGVFDECNGYIAEGWRELGANPSSSDLLVGVVASPENASVECKSHDGGDVGCLNGALCGMLAVVAVEVVPELWNGQLSWVLRVKVLKDNVEGAAGDAEKVAAE